MVTGDSHGPREPERTNLTADPYRAMPLAAPPLRPRLARLATKIVAALALAAVALVPFWLVGGFVHLPLRARALCWVSPEPGQRFSPPLFHAAGWVFGLTMRGEHQPKDRAPYSYALGTWIFLRCSCHVAHRDGRVVSKSVRCFD